MGLAHEKRAIIIAGLIIGAIAGFLVLAGNPANMGFCIACFIRDTVGGLGLHRAAPVQYSSGNHRSCFRCVLIIFYSRRTSG